MEFNFDIKEILPSRITIIESKDSNSTLQIYGLQAFGNKREGEDWIYDTASCSWDATLRKKKEKLESVVHQMGLASSKAQGLLSPITTLDRLLNSKKQKLYVIRDVEEPFSVVGILKIGQKQLFIYNDVNAQYEVNAMCLLDFYVYESKQRCGYGHELYEVMLKNENVEPATLAVDRPSFKLLSFLKKHYNLENPKPQPNNFVLYEGFRSRTESQAYEENLSASRNLENSNVALDSLQTFPVTSSNQLTGAGIEKCQHSNDRDSSIDNYFKKKRAIGTYSFKGASPYSNEREKNWGVYDAMHSYSGNSNSSSDCSLNAVDNGNARTERKLSQLQTSWNVLGVKPLNYSLTQKHS